MKKTKRQFSKGEISKTKMTPKERRVWRFEEARLIERNLPKVGDQHTNCTYCGRSYLITEQLQSGAGCGPCVNVVNWLPQAAKIMLDAVVYRLTALEALRQVHENDLYKIRAELLRQLPAKRRKKGRR